MDPSQVRKSLTSFREIGKDWEMMKIGSIEGVFLQKIPATTNVPPKLALVINPMNPETKKQVQDFTDRLGFLRDSL